MIHYEVFETELDEKVRYIYNRIRLKDETTIIAGGYVLDKHFGFDFNDVDIFCSKLKFSEIHSEIINIENTSFPSKINSDYEAFMLKNISGYTFNYEGIKFQVIFVEEVSDIINMFDFSFRTCFYKEGYSYFSENCITDYENKSLKLGRIDNLEKKVIRAAKFMSKYKMTFDEIEIKKLVGYLKVYPKEIISLSYLEDNLTRNSPYSLDVTSNILSIINKIKESNPDKKFNDFSKALYFSEKNVDTSIFEIINSYEKIHSEEETLNKVEFKFNDNIILTKYLEEEEVILNSINKHLLRLAIYNPELAKEFKTSINDKNIFKLQELCLHGLYDKMLRNQDKNFNELKEIYNSINMLGHVIRNKLILLFESYNIFNKEFVYFIKENYFHDRMNISDYIKNNYITIYSPEFDYLIYNVNTNEIEFCDKNFDIIFNDEKFFKHFISQIK